MEWLQTYKIGKAMIKNGGKIEEAYYQNYREIKNKEGKVKTPCVINIVVNTINEQISIKRLAFDIVDSIAVDNYFSSISGRFTSYFICNSYKKCSSILDFMGIKDGVIINDKKNIRIDKNGKESNEWNGLKNEISNLCKSRNKDFSSASFMNYREMVRERPVLCKNLFAVINDIGFLVESIKKLDKWNKLKEFSVEEIKGFRQFSKLNLSKDNGTDEVVYVTLTIDNCRLNREDEYKSFCIERFLDKGQINYSKLQSTKDYFSESKEVFDVSFPRDSINLLKSSTGSPTSLPNLIGTGFVLSEETYNNLKLGAKKIDENLRISIARVRHYVIPEFVGDIKIEQLSSEIVKEMELALSLEEFNNTQKSIHRISNKQVNAILLLGYQSDDRTIDFINSIRIPSAKYFDDLMAAFEKAKSFSSKIQKFSFQQIFNLFPVPSDKSKKPDSLFFYKSVFESTPYDENNLMNAYSDLCRIYRYGGDYMKAGRKLYVGTINIGFTKKQDFSKISDITIKFQALINLLNVEKRNSMDYSNLPQKTSELFKKCNYDEDKAALFYLGKLLRRAANAQSMKQKKGRRPVLDKINFGGIRASDLKWLLGEVLEKLKQYEVLGKYAHEDLTKFMLFFNVAEAKGWKLSDIENVFYIFSGYAMYSEVREVLDKKEEKEQGIDEPEEEMVGNQVEVSEENNENSEQE